MPNRRTFIKNGLLFCLAGSVLSCTGRNVLTPGPKADARWAMLVDLSRCNGCQSCVVACKSRNLTAEGHFATRIAEAEAGRYPAARITFFPTLCNHCDDPPCVRPCPTGATWKNADGLVLTDWNRCIGDGACIEACPYGARFMDPRFGKADKCDFCAERLAQGLAPACVESCPPGARLFGDLNHPEGEFAALLEKGGLAPARPELGLATGVLYRSAHVQEAV